MDEGGAVLQWLAVDAPAVPGSESGSTTVIVVVAIVTVVGTVATALGPTFVEIVKSRSTRRSATPPPAKPEGAPVPDPLSSVVRSGSDALDMVEAAVLDYRQQRDAALLRVDSLQSRLDEANNVIARQQVIIAQLEARLNAQNPPPSPYGQGNYGQTPPDWRRP